MFLTLTFPWLSFPSWWVAPQLSHAAVTGIFAVCPRESWHERQTEPCGSPLHKDIDEKLVEESCQFKEYLRLITRVPWTLTAHLRKKLNKGFPKIYNCESNTFPKYNFLRMIGHFTLEKRLSYLSILPIENDITKPLSCEETTKKNVENSVTEASPTIN